MAVHVEAVVQIVVPVTDVARSRRFYGGLLALEEIERPDGVAGAWYRAGTTVIQLECQPPAAADGRGRFCLWVEDLEEARQTLEAAGAAAEEAQSAIPGVRRLVLRDPDGNRVELHGPDGSTWEA